MSEVLREVRLYGWLGKKYGRVHRIAVDTAREATQALGVILPGFAHDVIGHAAGFHVFAGKPSLDNNIGDVGLDCRLGRNEPVCVVPSVAGAKSGGLLQVVIGVALVAVGLVTGNPYLVYAGAAMAIGGVIQALMPGQQKPDEVSDSRVASFAFGGVANTTEQGVAIPVVYGEVIAGSVVASQGLSAVEMAV